MILGLLGYLSDAAVLSTYWWLSKSGRPHWFHLANGIGWLPLVLIEVRQEAWQVIPLTATFGALGLYGLWKERT